MMTSGCVRKWEVAIMVRQVSVNDDCAFSAGGCADRSWEVWKGSEAAMSGYRD